LSSLIKTANVREFGAAGDGCTDDSGAFQRAFDSGAADIFIPPGLYRVAKTLRVRSNTALEAHPCARIFMCGDTPKRRGDFLLTNYDHKGGDENISLTGGVWDGNDEGAHNVMGPRFEKDSYSGAALNFYNVKGLALKDIIVANPAAYYIRMACLENFAIENVAFLSDRVSKNQDGLHFGGYVKNGTVKNVTALSKGQTNDDMIALNADDCVERAENFDLRRGSIENISFENITAQDCHTLIRILSVTAPVRNITFKNVQAGVRCYALNCDAARYCATPLFKEEDFPQGVGCIENVSIDGMAVHFTGDRVTGDRDLNPLIILESGAKNLRVRGFKYNHGLNRSPLSPALTAKNIVGATIRADDQTYDIHGKGDVLNIADFTELDVNSTESL